MLVWSGKGILPVILLVALVILFAQVLPDEMGHQYGFGIPALITGAFSWFMGKRWNSEEGRVIIDKQTGQEMVLKSTHTLFWINVQYWGILFAIFGVIMLAQLFM